MRKERGKEQQSGALVVECLTLGEPNLRVDLELEIQLLLQLHKISPKKTKSIKF